MIYKVKQGDTLFKIWRNNYINSLTWEEFKNYFMSNNEVKDINVLNANQKIKIPDISISNKNNILIGLGVVAIAATGIFLYKKFR
jgi:LysM repeat protein